MQIMPVPDAAGAVLACGVLILLAATLVMSLVAIATGIRARRKQRADRAVGGRIVGAIAFGLAMLLIFVDAHFSYDFSAFRLAPLFVLAGVGFMAWYVSSWPASRTEVTLGLAIAAIGVAAVAIVTQRESAIRERRDALFAAATRGDARRVRDLLGTGMSADLRDDIGMSLIEKAADARTALVILEAGADARRAPKSLVFAAQQGKADLVKVLLDHGADPNARVGEHSAARMAWWSGHEAILDLLHRAGSADARRLQQRTGVLIGAVHANDAAAVIAALRDDYLMEEASQGLRVAAANGNRDITMSLVDVTSPYGEIAVASLIVLDHGHVELFEELLGALEKRQPGYIMRETKAAALAIARERGDARIVGLAEREQWQQQQLPEADDSGVIALLRRARESRKDFGRP
jgi:hypothetical protein